MPLGKLGGFNLDAIFAFTTPRTVAIKDGTVGLVYYAAIVAVAVALAYQIFGLEKGFYKSSAVLGSATLSTLSPTAAWTSAGLGLAQPYCAPGSTSYAAADNTSYPGVYAVYPPAPSAPLGSFSYGANVAMPRLVCQATDAVWQIPNPLEVNALFLPTRIVKYVETAPYCSPDPSSTHAVNGTSVSNTTESQCRYTPGPKSSFWLPDQEAYTLRIDHAAAAPALGLSWSKDQMLQGKIVDINGNTVDPCAFYKRRNPSVPCPLNTQPNPTATSYISVGRAGVPDIVSLGTLLEAAGVPSLDVNGLPSTETLRYGGLTLVVQLNYDNYFSNDYTQARYSYKVQAIPGKVKGIVGASATGDIPSTDRYVFERSGVRVVLTFSGTVGRPDFTAGWTAAMSIITAFSIAALITTQAVNHLLSWSKVYSRYITGSTHDYSDLTPDQAAAVKALFAANEHVLAPVPAEVLAIRSGGAALALRGAPASAPASAPGEHPDADAIYQYKL